MADDVTPIWFGGHMHWAKFDALGNVLEGTKDCQICKEENAAFMKLMKEQGEKTLVPKVNRMQLVREYHQHYPYDEWAMINALEGAYVERGTSVFAAKEDVTTEEALQDSQAVDEWLSELPDAQQHVMKQTAEGYKPREIAQALGHANSAMVRLNKHEARKALGAPVNVKMRRVRKKK